MLDNKERALESLDYQETDGRERSQRLGAKILSGVHFESSHQPIVESSFNKAIKKGEKLPGKNDERRNRSYLKRLDKLIEKHGNKAEQKLWHTSIKNDLLVQYNNIPESYWDAKKQELRDNGYGNYELTEEYKHELYEKERQLQKESLEKWANYLGDEHSPYPLWFKVYAWDGMTKMGRYNKGKSKYETRNETTVAPYPNPDAEVLAGVFDIINRYHGNSERKFYTEDGERNVKLERIVQSGSFPKIFNAIQQDIAPIMEPPEKPEDVHGEWVEYELGEEDDVARAARGTGWCVASPSVGRHYLEYGTYGHDDEFEDYEYDDDSYDNYDEYNEEDDNSQQNHAKFILFHLVDEKTGKLSKNACASIRLDPDGNVAEISGLRDGQALDDSLVPIVENKVGSLPGGEEFLLKFADKNHLIALDRKMERGEELTKEDLEFLYEIHRPIETLDTYNDDDPRIEELRRQYDIKYALEKGINVDQFISLMEPFDIAENLDTLINHGATIDINQLVSQMRPYEVNRFLDTLRRHGANIDQLVSIMFSRDIAENLDTLINHGATIDINQLVSRMGPFNIAENLDTLINHGATIDINQLVSQMRPSEVNRFLDTLINHGANADQLVSRMEPSDIAKNLDTLINHGATIDADQLVPIMFIRDIAENLDTLINHGATIDVDQLVSRMTPRDIVANLDTLINHGATIDINQLVSQMRSRGIAKNLDTLINHGADINQLVSRMGPLNIAENLDTLINHGATIDINQLVSQMRPSDASHFRDTLRRHGANI